MREPANTCWRSVLRLAGDEAGAAGEQGEIAEAIDALSFETRVPEHGEQFPFVEKLHTMRLFAAAIFAADAANRHDVAKQMVAFVVVRDADGQRPAVPLAVAWLAAPIEVQQAHVEDEKSARKKRLVDPAEEGRQQ